MLRNLDIDLLRTFAAVADHSSFTHAGSSLGRTQSAVSMQIQRLERLIGQPLFDRNRKAVAVTAAGETLLVYARRILTLNDEAYGRLSRPDMEGVVSIGAPDDYATFLLPQALASFSQAYPQVRLEVLCDNGADLLSQLRNGKMDLALVTHPADNVGGDLVRYEPLRWVTSRLHTTHERETLPLALFPPGCVCRDIALRALDQMERPWRIAFSSRSISVLQNAVASGLALSVMEAATAPEGVRLLDQRDGFPRLPDVAISLHRKPGALAPAAVQAAQHIMDTIGASSRT